MEFYFNKVADVFLQILRKISDELFYRTHLGDCFKMMLDVLSDSKVFRRNFIRSKSRFIFNTFFCAGRQCYVMMSFTYATNKDNEKSVGKKANKAGS